MFIYTLIGVVSLFYGTSFAISSLDIIQKTLPNGLTILVKQDHRVPVAYVGVWYRVGGSYEHNGITGISHMLEHMMFKGTTEVGPDQFVQKLENMGAVNNAFTSSDFTGYFEILPADKVAVALQLEADRMRHLKLQQGLFEKEHQVVIEERRMRIEDNPIATTYERFLAAAYINSPYRNPVVGWPSDMNDYSVAKLQQWYNDWYQPNNAFVLVVGDVKAADVFDAAEKAFGSYKKQATPSVYPRSEISSLGVRRVTVKLPAQSPWMIIGFNVPSLVSAKDKTQAYALELLTAIMDMGQSSRLNSNLVIKQRVANSMSASYNLYALYSTLFTVSGIPSQNHDLQQLQQATLQQIKLLQTTPVSAAEIARAKAQIEASFVYSNDSVMDKSAMIATPFVVGLPYNEINNYIKGIQAVTAQQIQQVAQKFLNANDMTVATLQPQQSAAYHPQNTGSSSVAASSHDAVVTQPVAKDDAATDTEDSKTTAQPAAKDDAAVDSKSTKQSTQVQGVTQQNDDQANAASQASPADKKLDKAISEPGVPTGDAQSAVPVTGNGQYKEHTSTDQLNKSKKNSEGKNPGVNKSNQSSSNAQGE